MNRYDIATGRTDEILEKKITEEFHYITNSVAEIAREGIYVTAIFDVKTKLFYGVLMVNQPTPKGSARWITSVTDKKGYNNHREASIRFKWTLLNLSEEERQAASITNDIKEIKIYEAKKTVL